MTKQQRDEALHDFYRDKKKFTTSASNKQIRTSVPNYTDIKKPT